MIQHSVISDDKRFDGVAVRNVEVTIRDNDTPGVYVTEVAITGNEGAHTAGNEDRRSIVIEGHHVNANLIPGDSSPAAAGSQDYTGLLDIVQIALAMEPNLGAGNFIYLDLVLNLKSSRAMTLVNLNLADSRFEAFDEASIIQIDDDTFVLGRVKFSDADWDLPIQVGLRAYDDSTREDPATAVVKFACSQLSQAVCGQHTDENPTPYPIPNLRSGPGLLDVEVIDDDSAGVVPIESDGSTLVVTCSPAPCVPSALDPNDTYTLRLTKQPVR